MYNPQVTHSRIKELSKNQKISIGEINKRAGLGENAISQLAKSQDGMITRNLYEIAQCLDCSVDYLLGRTDNPLSHKGVSITMGNVSDNKNSIIGNASSDITLNTIKTNSQETALLEHFRKLDETKKAKVLLFANDLSENK